MFNHAPNITVVGAISNYHAQALDGVPAITARLYIRLPPHGCCACGLQTAGWLNPGCVGVPTLSENGTDAGEHGRINWFRFEPCRDEFCCLGWLVDAGDLGLAVCSPNPNSVALATTPRMRRCLIKS
jgi:hypothetical protein